MNCRRCGHPKWRHETPLGCESVLSPDGSEFEPCRCPEWKGAEVTSSDIEPTSSDIPDGAALLDGRIWSVVAAGELPDGDRMARLSPVNNELAEWGIGASEPDSSREPVEADPAAPAPVSLGSAREHDICGSDCWCNPTVEVIPAKGMGGASRPAQWRHAVDCPAYQAHMSGHWAACDCGLANLQTRIKAGEPAAVTPAGQVSSAYEGREAWWLSMIREAELDERMWSGGGVPSARRVAHRVADMLEEVGLD